MKIVEIEWVDSNHSAGWTDMESAESFVEALSLKCKTIGYLMSESEDRVNVYQSAGWQFDTEEPATIDCIMTIPKAAITGRRYLK